MELSDALSLSTEHFRSVLAKVGDDDLALATPCEKWSVAELIWHVARGSDMSRVLLDGGSKAQAIEMFKLPVPPDLLTECLRSLDVQSSAFRAAGDLGQIVHHPLGDVTVRQLFDFRIMDLTLHAWDLARAIGANEVLPDELVTHVYEMLSPLAEVVGQIGIFGTGPSQELDDQASSQQRLLDLSGRRP